MNETFEEMYNGMSKEEMEIWSMEKSGKLPDIGKMINQFNKRAIDAIRLRVRIERSIKFMDIPYKLIPIAHGVLMEERSEIRSKINEIAAVPYVPVENEINEIEIESKIIVRAIKGKRISLDIVKQVEQVVQSSSTEIDEEPVEVDNIVTIFKSKNDIKDLIVTSAQSPDIQISTPNSEDYVIVYSKPRKGVHRPSDILAVGILNNKKSINSALHKIAQLKIPLSPESWESIRNLKKISLSTV